MRPEPIESLTIDAPDLPSLFAQALAHLFGGPDDVPETAAFIVGFATRAADVGSLLTACVTEIGGLAADHRADVRACDVSGVMPIDEGYRAWGFLTLVPAATDSSLTPVLSVDQVTVDQPARQRWRMSLTLSEGRAGA